MLDFIKGMPPEVLIRGVKLMVPVIIDKIKDKIKEEEELCGGPVLYSFTNAGNSTIMTIWGLVDGKPQLLDELDLFDTIGNIDFNQAIEAVEKINMLGMLSKIIPQLEPSKLKEYLKEITLCIDQLGKEHGGIIIAKIQAIKSKKWVGNKTTLMLQLVTLPEETNLEKEVEKITLDKFLERLIENKLARL